MEQQNTRLRNAGFATFFFSGICAISAGDQFLADVREKVSDNKLHVREDMEIGEEDRLITLSTCVSGERNHRYLVIGVLVETALYR